MNELRCNESNFQNDWILVDEEMKPIEEEKISEMEVDFDENINAEPSPFNSNECCDNIDCKVNEELCVESFESNDDVSDPGLYDQFLPDVEISAVKLYQHLRNDRLNFYLDILLILSIAITLGLGTGYFFGWSNRCLNQVQILPSSSNMFKNHAQETSLTLEPFADYALDMIKNKKNYVTSDSSQDLNTGINVVSSMVNLSADTQTFDSPRKQNEVIIENYKTKILNEFSYESNNLSSETGNGLRDQKTLSNTDMIFNFKDLNLLKDIMKALTEIVKFMHEQEDTSNIGMNNPKNSFVHLKTAPDLYENVQLSIGKKVEYLQTLSGTETNEEKIKLLKNMSAYLVNSVKKLYQVSINFIEKNEHIMLKTKTYHKKSLNIFENLEKRWEEKLEIFHKKNKNQKTMFVEEKSAMNDSQSESSDKKFDFKIHDQETMSKEKERLHLKTHSKKSDFKVRGKDASRKEKKVLHFEKIQSDLKIKEKIESDFETKNKRQSNNEVQEEIESELKIQGKRKSNFKMQDKIEYNRKTQDGQKFDHKSKNKEEPGYKNRGEKESDFDRKNKKESNYKIQDKKESHFDKKNKRESKYKIQDKKEFHFDEKNKKESKYKIKDKKESHFDKENKKESKYKIQDKEESNFDKKNKKGSKYEIHDKKEFQFDEKNKKESKYKIKDKKESNFDKKNKKEYKYNIQDKKESNFDKKNKKESNYKIHNKKKFHFDKKNEKESHLIKKYHIKESHI